MALSAQRITDFAPVLMMHPDETCWPMDPMEFIKQSRFRHHRGLRADRGYNKRINKWVEGDKEMSDYYDIPVEVINQFGPGTDNRNRRPRDSNAGKRLNVFLEAKGHPQGVKNPSGIVPVFYYQADTRQFTRVSYWWFMGYNQAPLTLDHQGDWEHVTLKVENDVVTAVHFARHNDPVKFIPIGGFEMAGEKVRVYCSRTRLEIWATRGIRRLSFCPLRHSRGATMPAPGVRSGSCRRRPARSVPGTSGTRLKQETRRG
jgi:hypothetical protein